MSVDYYLEIAASYNAKQILDLICNKSNIEKIDKKTFALPGLCGYVLETGDRIKSLVKDEFGFYPTVNISFVPMFQSDESIQGRRSIIKISMLVLNYEIGDAVLSREYEQILFYRLNGKLVLNSKYFTSDSIFERTEDINLPYSIEDIKSSWL